MAVLLAIGCVYWSQPNDPLFAGKPLSAYLQAFSEEGLSMGGVDAPPLELTPPRIGLRCSDPKAYDAIRGVGTNALPMLVRMLDSHGDRLHRVLSDLLWTVGERFPSVRTLIPLKPSPSWARQVSALAAFGELGPRGRPALPSIEALFDEPDNVAQAVVAFLSVQPEQEADILSLTNALCISLPSAAGGTPQLLHSAALLALSTFERKAAGAIPVVMDYYRTTTNGRARAAAAIALARMGAPAGDVLPGILAEVRSLANAGRSPVSSVPLSSVGPGGGGRASPGLPPAMAAELAGIEARMESDGLLVLHLYALAAYGPEARSALPLLTNLLDYPVGPVRVQPAAAEAIERIRGDAAAIRP